MRKLKYAVNCGAVMLCAACCAFASAQTTKLPLSANRSRSSARPTKLPNVKLYRADGQLNLQPLSADGSSDGSNPSRDMHRNWVDEALSPVRNPDPNDDRSAFRQATATDPSTPIRHAIHRASGETHLMPLQVAEPVPEADLQKGSAEGLVSLFAADAPLKPLLKLIADHHGVNLVVGPNVDGTATISIRNARMEEVLDALLGVSGFSWHRVENLLYVTSSQTPDMDPRVQGLSVQVYPLDYVAAAEVEAVANGLLSPLGDAYISEASATDQLRTREILVVEDTAAGHARIAQLIAQIDIPPRQVLVEAHVLQISLSDEERHGIDLKALARIESTQLTLQGAGFTEDGGEGKAVTLRLEGRDMESVIEMIREHSNSRTLASPKLSVVNHQEAKIQIGQRLPYSVATTTQTTTVESVEFLDVGIVLTVQPVITNDGNVLMTVFPKVSGGKILDNGFPEEDTTEVQTTILMQDGGGVIIGGLIREEELHSRAIVPYLGRIPLLGHLFKRHTDSIRRNELIVALVTRVMTDTCSPRSKEAEELELAIPDYAAFEMLHTNAMPTPAMNGATMGGQMLDSELLPPSILQRDAYDGQELPAAVDVQYE
ncbi:MAG: type II secretion system protein GspD [Rubripirellula sp.]